jgi:hypothetical protein
MIKPGQVYLNRDGKTKEIVTKVNNDCVFFKVYYNNVFVRDEVCPLEEYENANLMSDFWTLMNQNTYEEEML